MRTVRLLSLLSLLVSVSLTSCSSTGLAVIRGFDVDFNSIVGKDWSTVLGNDFFPSVKPRMVTNGTVALSPAQHSNAKPTKRVSGDASSSEKESAVESSEAGSDSEEDESSVSRPQWTEKMKQALERGVFLLFSSYFPVAHVLS
jgi:hypothetical protein